jgi:predicted transposase YdaD
MQDYDAALKWLLRGGAGVALRQVTGGIAVVEWLDGELQRVQTRRADLVGVGSDGQLLHLELQSANDSNMPLRMAEYALGVYRQFGKLPRQIVLYVGDAPLRMAAAFAGPDPVDPGFAFRYRLIDVRDLDTEALLASPWIEDNVLAILSGPSEPAKAVRRILERVRALEEPARHAAFAQFLILSGLRSLEQAVKEEAEKMPVLNDILDHQVIGPAIQQGRQQGRLEGRQEALQEGLQKGRLGVVRRLIEKRFGPIQASIGTRLAGMSAAELDDVALRLLDAARVDDLFTG